MFSTGVCMNTTAMMRSDLAESVCTTFYGHELGGTDLGNGIVHV